MADRTLDKTSDVPLYAQLAAQLREQIERGGLLPGDQLPSETSVGDQFKVSRITVRQAMARLVADGLIQRSRGRGTYVRGRPIVHHFAHSFEEELFAKHVPLKLVLRGWRKKRAPVKVAEALYLKKHDDVFELERVKFVHGEPIGWELRYLPLRIGQEVPPDDLSTLPVYQLLKRSTGAHVSRIVSTVLSVGAAPELARMLRVRKGHPLLMREQTYFADNDLPLMHGVIAFRGDRYRFIFECGPGQLRMDATTVHDQTRLMR